MESGEILDAQITASSLFGAYFAAKYGRLNLIQTQHSSGGWSAAIRDSNQWLQVDLGRQYSRVTGVATQGRHNTYQWVTRYKLQYRNDEASFRYYIEQGQTKVKLHSGHICSVRSSVSRPKLPKPSGSNISNTRQRFSSHFQTPRRELKVRRAAEYFWRTSRCFEMWWTTLSSCWYIFSIETKTTTKTEK